MAIRTFTAVVHKEGNTGCVVPLHDELATGTLRGILRQASVTPDEFHIALKSKGKSKKADA